MNSLRRPVLSIALPMALSMLILGGCAAPSDVAGEGAASGETPAPAPHAVTCDLIDADQVTALAGQALDGPYEAAIAGSDLPACVWGDPAAGPSVQVSRFPAQDWAVQLPEILQQLESTGMLDDAENTRKIREASELVGSGTELAEGQACDLFSTMLEITGAEPGQSATVNIVPNRENPQALTGQSCSEGVFSSVLVIRDGIAGVVEEVAVVEQALATVTSAR